MDTLSQNPVTDRQPVASGRFYPSGKESLTRELEQFFGVCKEQEDKPDVRAIVSPHAGYVFSGKIAASAYASVERNKKIENVFIIGSSHVMSFDGASVYNTGDYITPLGRAEVNIEIADQLKKECSAFNFSTASHLQEHSIEVQIPFIQYYFTSKPFIVPIVIGTTHESTLKQIAQALKPWFTEENLFVISSDFSHYPSYNDAVIADKETADGLASGSPDIFLASMKRNTSRHMEGLATSMCGWSSGLILLYMTQDSKNLEFRKIDYCNSGDSDYGDKDRVVGYHSIALINKGNNKPGEKSFSFTEKEKKTLFDIARTVIRSGFHNSKQLIEQKGITDNLMMHYGAFVTLKINGNLRGCIGRFVSDQPLYEVVKASAMSSAFDDPRFPKLTPEEFEKTEIEITVLGPMRKISSPGEIELGKHGIYIKKDYRAGTMLPQVATEQGWNVEQFLGYTSRDKAGLGWDGWKDAEVFVYEGVILKENDR